MDIAGHFGHGEVVSTLVGAAQGVGTGGRCVGASVVNAMVSPVLFIVASFDRCLLFAVC